MSVTTGLERCVAEPPNALRAGAPYGLLAHQASVDRKLRSAPELLVRRCPNLKALFSPQHGVWGTEQANMIETEHSIDPTTKVPVHSLYSETRRPTPEMLADIDWLVVDLQDVGTRVYTYVWTVVHCLVACAEADVRVLILDRPNPIGGRTIEGPRLDINFTSFVGMAPIPMRHGLTLGELVRFCNESMSLGARLDVLPMAGWDRDMYYSETGLPWVLPSPNMPQLSTALSYPGQVLLEGVNISEGRGTTLPFELTGAPFIDGRKLADAIRTDLHACGINVRATSFQPTFDKWKELTCHGVAWHWDEPRAVRSYAATLTMLAAIKRSWPSETAWLRPPYEYEFEKPPIDILTGSADFRIWLDEHAFDSAPVPDELINADEEEWLRMTQPFRLY